MRFFRHKTRGHKGCPRLSFPRLCVCSCCQRWRNSPLQQYTPSELRSTHVPQRTGSDRHSSTCSAMEQRRQRVCRSRGCLGGPGPVISWDLWPGLRTTSTTLLTATSFETLQVLSHNHHRTLDERHLTKLSMSYGCVVAVFCPLLHVLNLLSSLPLSLFA